MHNSNSVNALIDISSAIGAGDEMSLLKVLIGDIRVLSAAIQRSDFACSS